MASNRYKTSTASPDAKPAAILDNDTAKPQHTYSKYTDEWYDVSAVISNMPETFDNESKLDKEGRVYKYVNNEWHIYDMMDSSPSEDDLDAIVDGKSEFPCVHDIGAGAATAHMLLMTKNSSNNEYECHPICYGGNGNGKYAYLADVDQICIEGCRTNIDKDGFFWLEGTDVSFANLIFSYKPVYHIRCYASDNSGIRFVKLSCDTNDNAGNNAVITADYDQTTTSKTFQIKKFNDAGDNIDATKDYTTLTLSGTPTSPDDILVEVW